MNRISDIKQSDIGWQCSHCGAFNKVITAKFCGNCGSLRPYSEPEYKLYLINLWKNIDCTRLINRSKDLLDLLLLWLFPPKNLIFKRVITYAVILLCSSVIVGFKMYNNVNTIRISQAKFSDVSIDYPIYSVCKNLLSIDAISFRKNLELAPYEDISATEWNHILKQASKHLNQEYSIAAYFDKDESISVNNLNKKLRALNSNSSEISDTSRIQSFYILEQILFY